MSKITEINPIPKEIEAWGRCMLIHHKRPFNTGKKIWSELLQKYIDEIVWICDECKKIESL